MTTLCGTQQSPIDENFLSVTVIKDGDRHTPDSLAGDAPVIPL